MIAPTRMLLLGLAFAIPTLPGLAATNLLVGLRYHSPPVKLEGRLTFLYTTNGDWSRAGHIYELSLGSGSLRVVVGCPNGRFHVSPTGGTFCVLHGADLGRGVFGTNAFIYSECLNLSRSCVFERPPTSVTFVQNHLYFFFDRRVFDYDIKAGILDPHPFYHDFLAGVLERASMPNAATDGGATNSTLRMPDDSGHGGFKAFNGRWLFFEGGDGPLKGTRLVSSPIDEFRTHYDDPKGKNVLVLKRFPKPSSGSYNLDQLSPRGRFALVRRSFPIGDGWGQTYYAVNVESGDAQALMEDRVCSIRDSWISHVHWVGSPASRLTD